MSKVLIKITRENGEELLSANFESTKGIRATYNHMSGFLTELSPQPNYTLEKSERANSITVIVPNDERDVIAAANVNSVFPAVVPSAE